MQVKVVGTSEHLPCKCEGPDGVKASKVIAAQCFVTADVSPRQPVDPFAKAYLLMNEVLAKKTTVQVPDAKKCSFKAGHTIRLWANETDDRFYAVTPSCGLEDRDYAKTCEPFGRYVTLFEKNQFGVH